LGPKNLQEFLSVNYADLAETDAKAQLKSGTRRVAHRCFSISQLKGKLLPEELANKIADMEENELSHIEPSSGSGFFAKRNYYFAKHSLALASGNVQTQHLKKLLDAWDRRPELKKANPKNYKVDLTNYLNVCLVANEFDEFEAALSTFQSIKNEDFISEAESEQHYYHLYLLFCLNVNQINKARELIPEIEECFKKYKSVLIPSRVLTISFNVFLALFGSGDYYKAFDWLNRISEAKYKQIRPDIHVFARVMELILNFELENYQYVENLYINAYRNLKKRKQLGEFERTVLMHVRKLANTIDSRRRKMLWQKLFEKLAKIKENNKAKSLTGLPEVAAWCKSRAENIPFFEAAKLI
jgi:tetratricopeptide (TPR) repeat protein